MASIEMQDARTFVATIEPGRPLEWRDVTPKPLTWGYLKMRQRLWDASLMGSEIGFLVTEEQFADLRRDPASIA